MQGSSTGMLHNHTAFMSGVLIVALTALIVVLIVALTALIVVMILLYSEPDGTHASSGLFK